MYNAHIQIQKHGDTSVMQWVQTPLADLPPVKENEVLVEHKAIGVNFIDIYHRTGLYPLSMPSSLGTEASGIVRQVGSHVSHVKIGDRVAYATTMAGSYSQYRVLDAMPVCPIAENIDFETAAAMMLKGLTAQYLLKQIGVQFGLQAGSTILWHAASGGVGQIACQWAKKLGLHVIATAGSEDKCQLAKENGAQYAIDYTKQDWVSLVREITQGKGVSIVYDSVGKSTFEGSLNCLGLRGLMVSFGNASGAVESFSPSLLASKGSLFITRPTLGSYANTRERTQSMAQDLFHMVGAGDIKINISKRYPLKDAAKAHEDLAARRTTGSIILIP